MWLASMVSDIATKERVYSQLRTQRGYPPGCCKHSKQCRTQGYCKINAQQVLAAYFIFFNAVIPPLLILFFFSFLAVSGESLVRRPTKQLP